jgi:hypothetical protein
VIIELVVLVIEAVAVMVELKITTIEALSRCLAFLSLQAISDSSNFRYRIDRRRTFSSCFQMILDHLGRPHPLMMLLEDFGHPE